MCQATPPTKLSPEGSYLSINYDVFKQIADFVEEGSVSSLTKC